VEMNEIEFKDRNGKIINLDKLPEIDRKGSEMCYHIMVRHNEVGTIAHKKDIIKFTRMHLEDPRRPISLFRKPISKNEEKDYAYNFSIYLGEINN